MRGALCQIVEKLLCRHIPDRFEHLVRYVGWYSCRCRGERAQLGVAAPVADGAAPEDPIANAVRARSAWARLIDKVYEVDPLECPKCKGQMQVIALIDDPAVVRRILKHLNLWSPAKQFIPARGPPYVAPECAQAVPLNEHTYHPVPDIA